MDFPLCLSDEVLLTLTGDSRNAVSPLVTAELLSKGLGSGAQRACVCVCVVRARELRGHSGV